jgi:hypothetical protein
VIVNRQLTKMSREAPDPDLEFRIMDPS